VHALADAYAAAASVTDRPSLIVLRTIIAWPAPHAQNTGAAHGSALGADEIKATKEMLGFDPEVDFAVDDEVLAHTHEARDRGADAHSEWQTRFGLWVTANG